MIRDLRFAIRALRKNPAFSLLAMCVLGAGIGAATAIFSVASVLLFRPLALPELDRLIQIGGTDASFNAAMRLKAVTPADYFEWREATRTIGNLSLMSFASGVNLSGDGEPERARRVRVTADFFAALAVRPLLGRTLATGDDEPGAPPVAVVGEALWRRRFGGDPAAIGQTMRIDGEPHRIVGVMRDEVRVPAPAELWTPLAFRSTERTDGIFGYQSIGRIRPGSSLAQVNAELTLLAKQMGAKYPDTHGSLSAMARPIVEELSGNSAPYTRLMLGATLFLVLLACVNVANLQFARVSGRAKEFAVQVALGAGRGRLLRRLIVESAAVGLAGGLAGAFAGYWGVELIRSGMPAEIEVYLPGWRHMSLDWRALAYALSLGVGSGLLAGIAAAFSGSMADPMTVLRASSRGSSSNRSRGRVRNALVVIEASLAIVLLAGAGLMVRGFQQIARPAPGMDPEQVLTFQMDLNRKSYPDAGSWRRFSQSLLTRMRSVPGVTQAALASSLPYSLSGSFMVFQVKGREMPRDVWSQMAQAGAASAGYFQTMQIPIRRGRGFLESDDENAARVVIVNEAFARKYFPGEDPLGRQIRHGRHASSTEPWCTIVGIAADVRHYSSEREVVPAFIRPTAQAPVSEYFVAVRTAGDPLMVGPAVRDAARAIDPSQSIFGMKRYDRMMDEELTGFRYVAALMGLFGLLALILAAVGLYAVLAYSVTERTHEIGIRMALGATRERVLGSVMRQGLILVAAGLAIGLFCAVLLGRLISGLLFGVKDNDPASILTASSLLIFAAAAACYLPARRAASADPLEALRHD